MQKLLGFSFLFVFGLIGVMTSVAGASTVDAADSAHEVASEFQDEIRHQNCTLYLPVSGNQFNSGASPWVKWKPEFLARGYHTVEFDVAEAGQVLREGYLVADVDYLKIKKKKWYGSKKICDLQFEIGAVVQTDPLVARTLYFSHEIQVRRSFRKVSCAGAEKRTWENIPVCLSI